LKNAFLPQSVHGRISRINRFQGIYSKIFPGIPAAVLNLMIAFLVGSFAQVLRFFCVWDDRDSMFGEMRPYVLHYFLVDDTVEIREVHRPNDGRDPFPVLLRRQRLPKNRNDVDRECGNMQLESVSLLESSLEDSRCITFFKLVLRLGIF